MKQNVYGSPSYILFLGYSGTTITDPNIDSSDKSPLEFANITLNSRFRIHHRDDDG